MNKKLKYWGWGYEDKSLSDKETNNLLKAFAEFGISGSEKGKFPSLEFILDTGIHAEHSYFAPVPFDNHKSLNSYVFVILQ